VFTESDWNNWSTYSNGDYYGVAKVKAEQLMREASEKHGFEVVSINPGVVFGPCLTKAHTKASPVFIRQLMYGNAQPDVSFTWVDVRDVAAAHAAAVEGEGIAGR
jgi:nucleoside-diphosphate-sugar epimerase